MSAPRISPQIVVGLLFCCFVLPANAVQTYQYQIIEQVDQDDKIFTQGFVFDGTWFYQSSGLYQKSFLIRYPLTETTAIKSLDVPPNIFAEGLTVMGDDLYLISWHAGTAWRFDANSFELEKTFRYSGEGWGLTHNQNTLIMSDGTDKIRFLSPDNFSTVRTIAVHKAGVAVKDINELEFAQGLIWANQWKTTNIFGINPDNGEVMVEMDISELQKQAGVNHIDSVANGIAYDAERDLFWLTGKYWRYRYLIKMLP